MFKKLTGKDFSSERTKIFFVGRATNEWHGTEEDVNILFGDPKKKETIFNCYDQMTWVDRDAQSPVYATNGSAFWRVIRAVSRNYFPNDDPNEKPLLTWRSHSINLYSNWLNYYVYQMTPYDVGAIGK